MNLQVVDYCVVDSHREGVNKTGFCWAACWHSKSPKAVTSDWAKQQLAENVCRSSFSLMPWPALLLLSC